MTTVCIISYYYMYQYVYFLFLHRQIFIVPSTSSASLNSYIDSVAADGFSAAEDVLARAMIYSAAIPFSFVENEYFKKFLKLFRPYCTLKKTGSYIFI